MMLGTGEKKDYLVINTTNTFEIIPGKTYSRNELEDFMTRKEIDVNHYFLGTLEMQNGSMA